MIKGRDIIHSYSIFYLLYFEEVKRGRLLSPFFSCHTLQEQSLLPREIAMLASTWIEIQICSPVLAAQCWAVLGLSFPHSQKNETSRRKGHAVHLQSGVPAPRRTPSWSWCTLCSCKTHHCSWIKCAIRHNGHTSSLYAGAPDTRPPLSSTVISLMNRVEKKSETGDTMLTWSRPVRIVTLEAVFFQVFFLQVSAYLWMQLGWVLLCVYWMIITQGVRIISKERFKVVDRSSLPPVVVVVLNRCRIPFPQQQQQ